ncbi:hypothetical protein M0M57_00230 [Flavobacterium azooxidireducens]|uniref:EpsG family protein n=1 Tax=Flavobacterium azooxidireducens TaxID=1871076 RepID=A0ABY4KIM3_9FLAO|nr:hypothetical protein [Flavobacterium azooxidireducens]UPQ79282.1 hypothetical protein M0M57_00230 [Flavobacterium azooxidireducens]
MDILFFIIIVILGLGFVNLFKSQLPDNEMSILKKLWFFHMLVGTGYYFLTKDGGGDAWGYWKRAKAMDSEDFWFNLLESQGTGFMNAFNYFPSKVLDLGFFTNTMFYTLLGFFGFVFFYLLAYQLIPFNSKFKGYVLFPLVFFMPNLHFWSSGIGKDTILFFCIGMFCYGLLNITKRLPLLLLALFLSYLVRPHITLFLVVSFGLAYVFGGKVSAGKRIFFSLILIGVGIAILPTVMEFAKIEEATVESFDEFSEKKVDLLSRGHTGSSLDISSYPFPLKVFTFLFRPLFFDINGIPAVVASFENLLLLILSYIVVFKNNFKSTFKNAPFVIKGMLFFLIIGTLAFSQSLGNLGIMIRMRNMFLPGLIIFILWSFSYQQELKNKSRTIQDEIEN